MRTKITLLSTLLLSACVSVTLAEKATDPFLLPTKVQSLIEARCIDCHSEDSAEGEV